MNVKKKITFLGENLNCRMFLHKVWLNSYLNFSIHSLRCKNNEHVFYRQQPN